MRIHAFRQNTARTCQKLFRDAVLQQPELRFALAQRINSLNLQGQISKNGLDETDALKLLEKTIGDFTRDCHTKISKAINPPPPTLDQNDLSNPINFEAALNNPDSMLSQNVNDLAAELSAELLMQAALSEQAEADQDDVTQAQAQQPEQDHNEHHFEDDFVKGAVIAEAIKLLEDNTPKEGEKVVKDLFEKLTGHAVDPEKTLMSTIENEEEKILAPKLVPPKDTSE